MECLTGLRAQDVAQPVDGAVWLLMGRLRLRFTLNPKH